MCIRDRFRSNPFWHYTGKKCPCHVRCKNNRFSYRELRRFSKCSRRFLPLKKFYNRRSNSNTKYRSFRSVNWSPHPNRVILCKFFYLLNLSLSLETQHSQAFFTRTSPQFSSQKTSYSTFISRFIWGPLVTNVSYSPPSPRM